ncbi:MAG: outer membrane protein assembly factor BamA, partial [Flavobacteriales bacterium]|nr:outer membrane protein assembly factor BamA [Flavobacteriales bacterium]
MNLIKKISINSKQVKSKYLFLFLLFTPLVSFSQQSSFDSGKKYTLGEITVSGSQSFNELTVIAFTGLKKGEELFIPGERISSVIKKLWEENLFSDVNIYVTNIQDNVVDLEINITELPTLNEVTLEGVRKGKAKELIKEANLTKGTKITNNLLTTTKNFLTNKYKKTGFLNTNVIISTQPAIDTTGTE